MKKKETIKKIKAKMKELENKKRVYDTMMDTIELEIIDMEEATYYDELDIEQFKINSDELAKMLVFKNELQGLINNLIEEYEWKKDNLLLMKLMED